jgi:hypothetical protein
LLKLEFRRGISERDLEGAWTLASTADIGVRREFVSQLLSTPQYAEHFLIQPDLATHALMNVNPNIREMVMPIVDASLKHKPYDVTTIAASAVALRSGKIDSIVPGQIFEAIKNTKDDDQLRTLMEVHKAVASRLTPEEAYALANQIIDGIKGTPISSQTDGFIKALEVVARQLKPEDAYALARPIAEAIKNTATSPLVQTLRVRAAQLKPEDAYALALPTVDAIKATTNSGQVELLLQALTAEAPRLKPEDAYVLARPIVEASSKGTPDPKLQREIAVIALRLKPQDAYVLARPMAEVIGTASQTAVEVFTSLAGQLNLGEANVLARPMVEAIKGTDRSGQADNA